MGEGCLVEGVLVQPVAVAPDDTDPSKPERIRIVVAEGRNREVGLGCGWRMGATERRGLGGGGCKGPKSESWVWVVGGRGAGQRCEHASICRPGAGVQKTGQPALRVAEPCGAVGWLVLPERRLGGSRTSDGPKEERMYGVRLCSSDPSPLRTAPSLSLSPPWAGAQPGGACGAGRPHPAPGAHRGLPPAAGAGLWAVRGAGAE